MNFYQKKKKFKEIVNEFLDFIKNKRIIIHNAEFDLSHINNELGILGIKKIDNEIVDTLTIARDKFPGSSISLDSLCKRYRIDNSKRTKHTAIIDCELLSKVYINLIDQKEPTFDLKNHDHSKTNTDTVYNNTYFKKIIKPTTQDIEDHRNYLRTSLKKNFY